MVKVVGDVNDCAVHERVIESALKTFGKIDILINNAGIGHNDGVLTIDEANFDRVMNTNLKAVVFLTKACTPHLIEQKGSPLNT